MDTSVSHKPSAQTGLPEVFADWFAARGWQPRSHQLDMLDSSTSYSRLACQIDLTKEMNVTSSPTHGPSGQWTQPCR
ncbi:MAG: hypothetical protein AAFW74_02020, partial [Pseudomonadota bacterium]